MKAHAPFIIVVIFCSLAAVPSAGSATHGPLTSYQAVVPIVSAIHSRFGNVPGSFFQYDLGTARAVTQILARGSSSPGSAEFIISYADSADATVWTNVPGVVWLGTQSRWTTNNWINVGAHQFWRLTLVSPLATSSTVHLDEVEFVVSTGSATANFESLTPLMLSESGLSAFNPTSIVDGDTGDYGWHTDNAVAGAWLQIDLQQARAVLQINAFVADRWPRAPAYSVQYSDDQTTWSYARRGWKLWGPGGPGWTSTSFNTGAHRFWRLILDEAIGPAPWISELEVLTANSSNAFVPLRREMFASMGVQNFDPAKIADGSKDTTAWESSGSTAGSWVGVDLGSPRPVSAISVFAGATTVNDQIPQPVYDIQYTDGGAWTSTGASILPTGAVWQSSPVDCGSHRYWRLVLQKAHSQPAPVTELQISASGSPAQWLGPGMLTQNGLMSFAASAAVDDDTTDNAWHTDASTAGAWLQIDLAVPRSVTAVNLYAQSAGSTASYEVQFSDDLQSWTDTLSFFPSFVGWNGVRIPPSGRHRYWRLFLTNTPGPGSWIMEVQVMCDDDVLATIDPSSLAQSGLAAIVPGGLTDSDRDTYGFHTDTSSAGAWVEFQVLNSVDTPIGAVALYAEHGGSAASYSLQALIGTHWYTLQTGLVPSLQGWNVFAMPGNASYERRYRLLLENTPGPGSWISELQLLKWK